MAGHAHGAIDIGIDGAADAAVTSAARREELAGFLLARRNAIQPRDAGLPSTGRRRVTGLRRHEVADLTYEATSKVTGKVLDDEDHRRLIEEAIGDLDFSVLERETA